MLITLAEHISVDPNVFQGRPCIRGTRIPVDLIFEMYDQRGLSPEEIAAAFSDSITLSDAYAALSYYYDNQAEIEAMVAESEASVEQWKRDNPDRWKSIGADLAG